MQGEVEKSEVGQWLNVLPGNLGPIHHLETMFDLQLLALATVYLLLTISQLSFRSLNFKKLDISDVFTLLM